ncbi:hypothetical protein D9M71_397880 [compost metagenome]
MAQGDAVAGQFGGRADAGEHQQLWGVDAAGAEDHLVLGMEVQHLAVLADFHAHRAFAFQQYAVGEGRAQHMEVGSVEDRMEECPRRAAAFAIDLGDVEGADAFLLGAIEVGVVAPAEFVGGLVEHLVDRAGAAQLGDVQLAAPAVPGRFAGFEVLGAAEVGQHLPIAPASVAQGGPVVIVVAVATDVDHSVDGAGAAPYPPAWAGDIRLAAVGGAAEVVHPVPFRVGDQADDASRGADVAAGEQVAVAGPGLDQADRDVRVCGQPIGQHAAG